LLTRWGVANSAEPYAVCVAVRSAVPDFEAVSSAVLLFLHSSLRPTSAATSDPAAPQNECSSWH